MLRMLIFIGVYKTTEKWQKKDAQLSCCLWKCNENFPRLHKIEKYKNKCYNIFKFKLIGFGEGDFYHILKIILN